MIRPSLHGFINNSSGCNDADERLEPVHVVGSVLHRKPVEG